MSIMNIFKGWKEVESHPEGAVILSEKDVADGLYFILSGEVELSLHGEVLGSESKGGIIGEMSFIEPSSGNPTAKALSEVQLARLNRKQFKQLMAENPQFSMHAMKVLATRLRTVNVFISSKFGGSKKQ